jgi:hypothetical protein
MKYPENTKFNVRLETVNSGILTEFKGIRLEALLKWLKYGENSIDVNIIKGNELLLNHTNSRSVNKNTNDRL